MTGDDPAGGSVSDQDTVTMQTPVDAGIQIVKTATLDAGSPVMAGDSIRYRFEVTNVGVVTLHGVDLVDALAGLSNIVLAWPSQAGVLAPGATLVGTASYTLTQDDVDAGQVLNTATTHGTTPQGAPVADEDTVTVLIPAAPAVTLDKTAATAPGVWQTGNTVRYGFTITNTGNVTLYHVSVNDPMPGLTQLVYAWPGADGALAPGETATATAEYTMTAADAAARSLTNTATVTTDRDVTAEDTATLTGPADPPPASTLGGWLAHTGSDPVPMGDAAFLLLASGLVILITDRRKRAKRTSSQER